MIGLYLLLVFLIGGIAFGFYIGWDQCGRVIRDSSDFGMILLAGIIAGLSSVVVWILIALTVENFVDFVDASSEDDQKVAALLQLTNLQGIEIRFKDTSPKIYCEIKHNGEIIAPMAKRRETARVYNKILVDKKNKTKSDSENRLDNLIKSHLEK